MREESVEPGDSKKSEGSQLDKMLRMLLSSRYSIETLLCMATHIVVKEIVFTLTEGKYLQRSLIRQWNTHLSLDGGGIAVDLGR